MKNLDSLIFNEFTVDEFHTSHEEQLYMLSFMDRKFEITEGVYQLILLLQQKNSIEDIASAYSDMRNKRYTPVDIQQFIETRLMPILESNGICQLKRPFLISKPIISAQKLKPITTILSNLFHPVVFCLLLTGAIFLQVFFFFKESTQALFSFQGNEFVLLAAGFIVFISVIFHELGHASAARFYKASHGHIGIGIYLYYPVFYADVTGAWKIPRKQRAMIDIAGIYFQLLFLIPVTLLYLSSNNDILKYSIYMIDLSFIFNINPFFKFDGYWLLSDILGVPNLRKRTYEIIPYFIKKIKRETPKSIPFLLKMKLPEQLTMAFYTIIVNIFFCYFFLYKIPILISQYLKTYPEIILQLYKTIKKWIEEGIHPDLSLIQHFFFQTFFLLITLLILYRLFISLIQKTIPKKN